MKVGVLTVRLRLHGFGSLKEKRSLMKRTIHQLRQTFNLSIAEVDHHDENRWATLGIACVANEAPFVHRVLDKVIRHLERLPDCDVEATHLEVWP